MTAAPSPDAPDPLRVRLSPRASLGLVAALLVVVVAAWVGGPADPPAEQPAAPTCRTGGTEPLDPRSSVAVLPNAPDPSYPEDPPTSGPHLNAPGLTGVQDGPLRPAVQVGLLREGKVVLQHRDLDEGRRRQLEALANDVVVVAPAPDLPEPVVATAWRHRLTCPAGQELAGDELAAFIFAHAGKPVR